MWYEENFKTNCKFLSGIQGSKSPTKRIIYSKMQWSPFSKILKIIHNWLLHSLLHLVSVFERHLKKYYGFWINVYNGFLKIDFLYFLANSSLGRSLELYPPDRKLKKNFSTDYFVHLTTYLNLCSKFEKVRKITNYFTALSSWNKNECVCFWFGLIVLV